MVDLDHLGSLHHGGVSAGHALPALELGEEEGDEKDGLQDPSLERAEGAL